MKVIVRTRAGDELRLEVQELEVEGCRFAPEFLALLAERSPTLLWVERDGDVLRIREVAA